MAIYEYKLPELGEGIHEGEIVKWLVKPGDKIEEDQIIVEVQNDKAVVEVPSPVTGTVKEVVVEEGTVSIVGDVLLKVEVEGDLPAGAEEATDEKQEEPDKEEKAEAKAAEAPKAEEKSADKETSGKKVLATPSVRKLAREQGVDLTQVTATGPKGRITREDVTAFASGGGQASETTTEEQASQEQTSQPSSSAKAPVAGERHEERVALKGMRRAISKAMVKSMYTAPHVTIMDEVDVTKLVELRTQAKPLAEKKGTKLTYLPFIVKALVAAARQFPALNASLDDEKEEIVYKHYYNVGIATDTDNGLIVPVIEDADRKSIWMIAEQIKDLAIRGREGKLSSNELRGSTITITNIGSAGGMFFTPIINHPEVAILGTGRISEKPVVKDGEVVVAPVMALSLSFDHRIIDGATAQHFVNYIKQLLEDPQLLILEV
ncbi:dihydrolipoamide acetyltransferase family protein [Bacillus horti]|uniref:Dihydrolipoamide acetyltransferase component of pyruvate dehydrogenase complex n=1 Tax=Caldalkalibacillus horti TaxID=77523 RepID=A0ABT9W4B1_9BACI|nr:dihydrolipoamide acetyltransferase family protein [Bacillus horti]MDQ0168078.1 pyruvate dehydrogenase E2 component (dihydrolipoamide acetyltransferase) [Bacillus horti]